MPLPSAYTPPAHRVARVWLFARHVNGAWDVVVQVSIRIYGKTKCVVGEGRGQAKGYCLVCSTEIRKLHLNLTFQFVLKPGRQNTLYSTVGLISNFTLFRPLLVFLPQPHKCWGWARVLYAIAQIPKGTQALPPSQCVTESPVALLPF